MKHLRILFCLLTCYWFVACNTEKPITQPTTFIRKNAHSTAAQADLEAMARGVKAMKALPCTDNRSWFYWGAMHHLPKIDEMGGYDTLCTPYGQPGFKMPDTWDNCPHMKPEQQQLHFLVWHRLYIWYYERIIRKFSGKKDFALPYWNYNDANQRTLPDPFRMPVGYDKNPIWEAGRSRWLMAGNAIRSSDKDSIAENVKGNVVNVFADPMGIILDTTLLWESNSFALFSSLTENMPHNCMHDYIGGLVDTADFNPTIYNRIYQKSDKTIQGLMAQVPSAGFDPIFFMHHANIDRLWTSWELDHPSEALTLDEFSAAGMWTYNFIDENGNEVRYTSLQQIFDSIRTINYNYDYLSKRKLQVPAVPKTKWSPGAVVATNTSARMLKTPSDMFSLDFSKSLSTPKDDNIHYSLEVEISVDGPAQNFIVVMVDVNDNTQISANTSKHVAGIAGLFGLQKHEGHGGHDAHTGHGDMRLKKTLSFDITDKLARQGGFDKKGITVYVHQLNPDKKHPVFIENITMKEISRKTQ